MHPPRPPEHGFAVLPGPLPDAAQQLAWYQRIWRAIQAIFCCCCYVPEEDDNNRGLVGRVGLGAEFEPAGRAPLRGESPEPAAAAADRARVGGESLEPAGAYSLQRSVLIYSQNRPEAAQEWLNDGLAAYPETANSPEERQQALHRYYSIVSEVNMNLFYEKKIFDPKQISTIPIRGRDGRKIQNCVMSEAQELAFVAMHALRKFNDGLIIFPTDREPIMAMYLLGVVSYRVAVWPLLHCLIADHKNGQAIDHRDDLIMGAASNYLTQHSTNNEMFLRKENDQIAQELLDNVVMPFFINAQGELHFLPAYTETN